jgi:hypothetical protein
MALSPFPAGGSSTFGWLRTGDHPVEFTLRSDDRPVAVLRWPETGSAPVTLTTADVNGTLERSGFLSPRITLRGGPGNGVLARLSAHLSHHVLELADGSSFRIVRAGMLVPAWKVTTAGGDEVAHIEPVAEGRKLAAGAVVVAGSPAAPPGLLYLLVVAWYLIGLMWFEDEAVEALAPLEGSGGPVGVRLA